MSGEPETLYEGRHLRLVQRAGWEYVERRNVSGVVVIVPITDDGRLVLVEQPRLPVGGPVIELPAGLAGDIPGAEHEALAVAARRELVEETGYEAATIEYLADGPLSAGLTSETATFFRATGLRRVATGGGDPSEQITVHHVAISQLGDWLHTMTKRGRQVAASLYSGLYLAGVVR